MKALPLFLLGAAALLGGCTLASSLERRAEKAEEIAAAGGLARETLHAGIFDLTAFARVGAPGAAADVYIEGDGLAWLDRATISPNPTPPDPTGLRLAAADGAANVVYLARPCQYTGRAGGAPCAEKYWTSAQSAEEVIAAYRSALDQLRARGIASFNLIGYSGGAGIAALAAAGRADVRSLRTVAGNTDHAVFTALHRVTPISESIDPITAAPGLARLPQRHFVGGKDKVVPPEIFAAWQEASASSRCVQLTLVPGNKHNTGWAEMWPELLKQPLSCE